MTFLPVPNRDTFPYDVHVVANFGQMHSNRGQNQHCIEEN